MVFAHDRRRAGRAENMNSKERMACAMRLGTPDRVPVMCQLSLGHYFLNCDIPSIDIWHSTDGFGEALIRLQRRYRFDGILINLPGRDPDWRSGILEIESRSGTTTIHWKNGWTSVCPPDDNPHVYSEDGRPFTISLEEIDPLGLFYVDPHELLGTGSAARKDSSGMYEFGERDFPPWQYDTIDYVRRRVGGEISIHSEIFSPFSQLLELIDHRKALLALMDEPDKCEACLDVLTEGTIALGRGQAAHGVDAILISSAFAGAGFISPAHYRRFVLPFERKVIQGIRESSDVPVYTHTCGSIADRLRLMLETGTDGIDTLDPPPLGNVDLGEAKRQIGQELFIKGNLDPVNVMLNGTRTQVLEAARRCIEVAAPGGGYILSTACSVPPRTPPSNLEALIEAIA